ncbi:hypothetical protein NC653_017924 [Populus alba x Populus x berolinensis]|uniref:Uncharacterized protein n=1 Tax=Populus alba x Populus x berolinensis TaxID=444605 RepID=A0AAD6QRJ3_9ROSI|nr:hypothetical protein NC653_017924 [Populus alba x Populus x berolinensis]
MPLMLMVTTKLDWSSTPGTRRKMLLVQLLQVTSLPAPSLNYHLCSPIMNHCSPFLTANY